MFSKDFYSPLIDSTMTDLQDRLSAVQMNFFELGIFTLKSEYSIFVKQVPEYYFHFLSTSAATAFTELQL